MMSKSNFIVDFVARGNSPTEWQMVLVEEGPWRAPFDNDLRRLQDRLYESVDAVLDGQMALKFPESRGKCVVIRLDGYSLPNEEVMSFFDRFAAGALNNDDYQSALASSPYVSAIRFERNLS